MRKQQQEGNRDMVNENERWDNFVGKLNEKGVHVQWAWEARRDGKTIQSAGYRRKARPADVGMVLFSGEGFQPSVLCAVVLDYGKDGFGIFTDGPTNNIDDDVTRIATPRADR